MRCESGPVGMNKSDEDSGADEEDNGSDESIEPAQNQSVSPSADSNERPQGVLVEGVLVEASTSWQGPLPPPDILDGYNKAIPARDNLPPGGDRILEVVEKRSQHQIDHEKAALELERLTLEAADRAIEAENGRSRLGLVFGFIIALVGIVTGAGLAAFGKSGVGLFFGLGSLVGLAGVFVYGTHSRRTRQRHQDQDSPKQDRDS